MIDNAGPAGHIAASQQSFNPVYESPQQPAQASAGAGAGSFSGATAGDRLILGDLSNLERDQNNQAKQMQDIKSLLIHAAGQENQRGQAVLADAISTGRCHTAAQRKQLQLQLQQNAKTQLGPVTLAVDDALATAAADYSQQSPTTAAAKKAGAVATPSGGYGAPGSTPYSPPAAAAAA